MAVNVTGLDAVEPELYSNWPSMWCVITRRRFQHVVDGDGVNCNLFWWRAIYDCVHVNDQRPTVINCFDVVLLGTSVRPVRVESISLSNGYVGEIQADFRDFNERRKLRRELLKVCDG